MSRKELATSYGRYLHSDKIFPPVRDWVAERTAEQVEAELTRARLPFCRVYEIPEVLRDPQVISEQPMVDVNCREAGQLKLCGTPLKLSEETPQIKLPPPRLGEHNREIYCGLLGYSEDDLAGFVEEGAV